MFSVMDEILFSVNKLKHCRTVAPVPSSWRTLSQFSQQVSGICAATEPQRVFLHLQLIVLVEVAVAGLELPTLTKQVSPLLTSPLGGGRIIALFPTTPRLS